MQLTISGQASGGGSSTATGLQTSTTVVSISTAAAPTLGQVLVATSNVAATWQTTTLAEPTGGGGDQVFYENANVVTANYTITSGKNAMSAGPITINSNVVVTVPIGSTWIIV